MRVRYHQLASYQPKPAVDVKPIDAWTLVHLLTGVGLGLVGVPGLLTLGANLFWEAAENWRRPHPQRPRSEASGSTAPGSSTTGTWPTSSRSGRRGRRGRDETF